MADRIKLQLSRGDRTPLDWLNRVLLDPRLKPQAKELCIFMASVAEPDGDGGFFADEAKLRALVRTSRQGGLAEQRAATEKRQAERVRRPKLGKNFRRKLV